MSIVPLDGCLRIQVRREHAYVQQSQRVRQICWDFGVPPHEPATVVADRLDLALRPAELVFLTGPSGSGKSSILAAIAEQLPGAVTVNTTRLPHNQAVVETVAPRRPLPIALEILTACGLGEPRLWLRRPCDLSAGERFRAALARAIGQANECSTPLPILCDEFTTGLHRRVARAIAYNIRRLVTRRALTLVVAAAHDDMLDDLRPDQVIRLHDARPAEVSRTPVDVDAPLSLQRDLLVEPGLARDYARFAPLHYRHRDGLGFVDKVFLLRHRLDPEPLGILVFAHAPMELAPRNHATGGRFIRNVRRLNRELRIVRRLVIHPDLRGCGLGHWFLRQTLPHAGVRFVECLAAMGAVNPVFEKAGMHRVGLCPAPRGRLELLQRLHRLRIDPFAVDFAERMRRCPRVRLMIESTIEHWVRATQSAAPLRYWKRGPEELARVFRQLIGRPPVYYLWDREGEFPRAEMTAAPAAVPSCAAPCDSTRAPADCDDDAEQLRKRRRQSPFDKPRTRPRKRADRLHPRRPPDG